MAEQGRREIVSDPLAFNAREQLPDRSLATVGVRNPGQSGGDAASKQAMYGLKSLGNLAAAVEGVQATVNDDMITEGKINYMQGMSEAAIIATGNKYTRQGYETLNSVEKSNNLFLSETNNMDELRKLSPEDYKKHIMEARANELNNLPDDPAVRKVYVAAFENVGPRLAEVHMKEHNAYLQGQGRSALSGALYSGAGANPDATRVMPGSSLRVSPDIVDRVVTGSDADKEYAVLTMLGEANGEGDLGLAAVAHVIKNRQGDSRWGGSIKDVVLAPKQFSTWNSGAGGNNPGRFRGGQAYARAAAIYDAVMSGHTVDPTNGATHYFSPQGMQKLVADGDQGNVTPTWLAQEEAKSGRVQIGGHIFVGKAGSGVSRVAGAIPAGTTTPSGNQEQSYQSYLANKGSPELPQTGVAPKKPLNVVESVDPASVSNAEGIPTANTPGKTQVRKLLEASNLKPEDKAAALADSMRRSLDDGTDQLFNDIGGVGVLYDLGAKPGDVDEVLKAKERFDRKEEDKFNVDIERAKSDIISRTKSGEFNSVTEATDAVTKLYDEKKIDDKGAKALFRQVQDAWTKSNVVKIIPVEARSDVSKLYTELADGTLNEADAGQAVLAIGKKYGLEPSDVNNFVASMFSKAEADREQARTRAETEFKKVQKEKTLKDAVTSALASDKPVDDITGTVRVKNDQGAEIEVNARQYAVRVLKDSEADNIKADIQAGRMKADAAPAEHLKRVYEKMARIGLVDEEHGKELQAAVRGNIAPKGALSNDARDAFDEYLQMVNNPNIGQDYVAKMLPDSYARSLFMTAELNYAGKYGIDDALLRAHEQLQRKDFNPDERITMNSTFQAVLDTGIKNEISNAIARPGWFGGFASKNEDIANLSNKDSLANKAMYQFVQAQANIYHVNFPQEDAEVSIKKAVQDLGNNLVVVGGNAIIGRKDQNQRLDQVMGLEGQDKTLPQQALDATIHRLGKGVWGDLYKSPKDLGVFTPKDQRVPLGKQGLVAADKQTTPPYYATYNPSTGIIAVQLWSDDKKSLVGNPMYINARASGARFKEQLRQPGTIANAVRSAKEGAVDLYNKVDFTTGLTDQGAPDAGTINLQ